MNILTDYFKKYHKDITIFLDTLKYVELDYIISNSHSNVNFYENIRKNYVALYKAGKRKLKIENIETILNNDL